MRSSPQPALGRAFAIVLAATALAACGEREEPELAATTTEPEFEITGDWEGRLTQEGRQPFTVRVTISSLERSKQNVVRYSGIDCAGTWEFLGAGTRTYEFREVIDSGAGRQCKGTGTVTLTPLTPDRLGYEFDGGGVTSEGTLNRS